MIEKRIDPFTFVPKYHQLYSILRSKIEDGELSPNHPIHSERELEEIYDVSRTTIRQALSMLENNGYIYREHGRGTFVSPPKFQNSLHRLTSFTVDMEERGLKPGQKILELKFVEPPSIVRQQLDLPESVNEVLCVARLRLADDLPIGLHFSYMHLEGDNPITMAEMTEYGSLYYLLHNKFNLIPTEADETLEATVADANEAQLLGISKGAALLLIERTVWDQNRKLMEFSRMLYRADRYKYYIHMNRRE